MKHLKTKLVSAIAMLAVAAIMMTSATYAWFTISTNPEVKGVKANITANGNLEIALDNGSDTAPSESKVGDYGMNTTWGNMVDVSSFFNGAQVTLKPVRCSLSSGTYPTFSYPVYGNDGRVKRVDGLTKINVVDEDGNYGDLGGLHLYTSSTSMAAQSSSAAALNSASIYAFEIDYWLRTNSSANISLLATGTNRDGDAANMPTGGGTSISSDDVTVIITVKSGSVYSNFVVENQQLKELAFDSTSKTWDVAATPKTSFPIAANTATEVKLYAYMNGDVLTNADAALALEEFTMNIQFQSDVDLDAMEVTPE